jgi:HlyD family secretion protein
MPPRTLSAIAVAVAAVAGAYHLSLTRTAHLTSAATAQTQPAPELRRIVALGRIEPSSEVVRIAAPAGQDAGRIADILITEGQWMERGEVIAVLDTRARLAAAAEQAKATLALRRAALVKIVADLENQEKTLTAAMEQQEAQRDRSKWEFERLQQLQRSGIYRDTALIDRRLALEGAEQGLTTARLSLERNQRRDASSQRIDEVSARAEVAAAEAALSRAHADLAFSEIKSPITGRILRRIGRPGEQIGQDGLAEIADTRVMFVRAEVFESDLRGVVVDSGVSVTSRALAEPVRGTVSRIGLKVARQSMLGEDPAASLDARVIEVMIRLDEPGSRRMETLTGLQVRAVFDPPLTSEAGAGS